MPGSPGPEVLGLTDSIMKAPHALWSLQGALGSECHLRSAGWREAVSGECFIYLFPGKERQPGDRASWDRAAPHGAELCPGCFSQTTVLPAATFSLEAMEGKAGSKTQTSLPLNLTVIIL